MMEIITTINVIISWEGYEIQGHIALKKIRTGFMVRH